MHSANPHLDKPDIKSICIFFAVDKPDFYGIVSDINSFGHPGTGSEIIIINIGTGERYEAQE
jgi:hypothetical protein